MSARIPYFKFTIGEYLAGDIVTCSLEAQAIFVNLMCYYWSKEGNVTLEDAQLRFPNNQNEIQELLKRKVIKGPNGSNYISIEFLDDQLDEMMSLHTIKVEAGKKGGEAAANKRRQQAKKLHKALQNNSVVAESNPLLQQGVIADEVAELKPLLQQGAIANKVAEENICSSNKIREDKNKIREDKEEDKEKEKEKDTPSLNEWIKLGIEYAKGYFDFPVDEMKTKAMLENSYDYWFGNDNMWEKKKMSDWKRTVQTKIRSLNTKIKNWDDKTSDKKPEVVKVVFGY